MKPAMFVLALAVSAALVLLLPAAARAQSDEPGCRQFDVCRDPADATLFFLYELYDDEAAIQAHLQSAHFLQMDQTTAGWVRSKEVRKLQRTGRLRLHSDVQRLQALEHDPGVEGRERHAGALEHRQKGFCDHLLAGTQRTRHR